MAPIGGRVSRHLVSVGNLVQGADGGGGATLLTSIVSLDPIYVYFDMDDSLQRRLRKVAFALPNAMIRGPHVANDGILL